MNTIPTDQNLPVHLDKLAAQRKLYAKTKAVFACQLIFSGPAAVAMAATGLVYPTLKVYFSFWGICFVVLDLVAFTPFTKSLRTNAAKIQELFDCEVLQLPWNTACAGTKPSPELIHEQAESYRRNSGGNFPLENWYSPIVGSLPIHIGRVICQRENCSWDGRQRSIYANWLLIIVVAVFVVSLFVGIAKQFLIEDMILLIFAPLAPFFYAGLRQYVENREAAQQLDTLKVHAEKIWQNALDGQAVSKVTSSSRELQNEIFLSRKRSPPVFEWIFRKIRASFESQMNYGAAQLADQAKQRLDL
ncbi:MAG: hypothetical protein JNJ49_13440 [Bdellovibrionaceae bacterium]|nr:hypothetical protein [Pseudobdellovibrionaceae bacterium]